MKQIIKVILIITLTLFVAYSDYYTHKNKVNPSYLDCGKITEKATSEKEVLFGSKTIMLLCVQFEKTGFKTIEVDYNTFFKYKVGQNVCFNLYKVKGIWHYIFAFTSIFTTVITIFLIIVRFIFYIFCR